MSSSYDDLFVRSNLKEDNTLPRSGQPLSDSPDIITWGSSQAEDPAVLFSDDYNNNVSKAISYGTDNYIYIRAKNFKDGGAQRGTVIVYVSSKSNLSNPTAWTRLTTKTGNNSVPVGGEQKGDVAVTEQPFVWAPSKPSSEDPYSLIAVVYTDEHPSPVNIDAPDFSGIQDLVADNGGVGWVEYAVPKPPEKGLTSTSTTTISLDNREGDKLSFMVRCNNVPVGAQLAFSTDKADADGDAISLPRTTVTTPNMEPAIPVTLDANYTAKVTLELYAENLPAQSNYSLTFECIKTTGSGMSQKVINIGGFSTGILVSQES